MLPLVAIGDSLTQGFQSGAISKTQLSYTALIARAMGVGNGEFRTPNFTGEGGLPLNLELLLRELVRRYGPTINMVEAAFGMAAVQQWMGKVEDYWERGDGNGPSGTGPLHHNLAVWGFEAGDADTLTERICRSELKPPAATWFAQVPEQAMYRTARRTLNPGFQTALEDLTQIRAAKRLAEQNGGIEHLIFWLGANNCLATVLQLKLIESTAEEIPLFAHDRKATLWKPEHFETVYRRVAEKVRGVEAEHVIVGNVPHVTIPPVTRGISLADPPRDEDGYFEYYTRFWVWDDDFRRNPDEYSSLTRQGARLIDESIDEYNRVIAKVAEENGWHLVDCCSMLDRLAFRRSAGRPSYEFPAGLAKALKADPNLYYLSPGPLDQTTVNLDTRYLRLDDEGRIKQGGVFSLDGVHLTTIGYGVIAHEMVTVMNVARESAGKPPIELDDAWWRHVVESDSLLNDPPRNLNHLRELLTYLAGRDILHKLIPGMTGFVR